MNRNKAVAILEETLEDYNHSFGRLSKRHELSEVQAAFDFLKRNPARTEVVPVTVKQMRQLLFNEFGIRRCDITYEMKGIVQQETKDNLPGVMLKYVQENVNNRYILQLAREAVAQALGPAELATMVRALAKEEASKIVTEWLAENVEFKAPAKK